MARKFTRYTHIVLLLAVAFLVPFSSARSDDMYGNSMIQHDASDYFPSDFSAPQDDAKKGTKGNSCIESCEADGEDVDECRDSCIQTVQMGDAFFQIACR